MPQIPAPGEVPLSTPHDPDRQLISVKLQSSKLPLTIRSVATCSQLCVDIGQDGGGAGGAGGGTGGDGGEGGLSKHLKSDTSSILRLPGPPNP